MNARSHEPFKLNSDELALLSELLQSERTKLLVEIRHTKHRNFRDELRHRLTVVEGLAETLPRELSADSGSNAA
jgi:hypothetical protein